MSDCLSPHFCCLPFCWIFWILGRRTQIRTKSQTCSWTGTIWWGGRGRRLLWRWWFYCGRWRQTHSWKEEEEKAYIWGCVSLNNFKEKFLKQFIVFSQCTSRSSRYFRCWLWFWRRGVWPGWRIFGGWWRGRRLWRGWRRKTVNT